MPTHDHPNARMIVYAADAEGICRFEWRRDPHSYRGQYLVRCICHQPVRHTWRPGEAAHACPNTGAISDGPPPDVTA